MIMKAKHREEAKILADIPNICPAMIRDFLLLKIKEPKDLIDKDPFVLYTELSKRTGTKQDPCVLDTYIAAIDFMNGAPARPWFFYTKARKKKYNL
jgi:hypothetical protein